MQLLIKTALLGATCLISASALAQSAADIITEMDSRKRASLNGINSYSQTKSTMGLCSLEYFEKESTQSVDGRGTVEYMRLVPISEVTQRRQTEPSLADASPQELDDIARQLRLQGPAAEAAMRDEMQSAGLPGGLGQMLMNPPGNQPWLSANPNDMLGMYATMLEGAADGKRLEAAQAAEARTEAQSDPLARVADRTRVVGREDFNGRTAIVLISEDLNQTQVADNQEFTINTMTLWVDANSYVPLKMRMDGVAREGNEVRDLRIEREDTDYRTVPGCQSMNEPFRTVMRIAGVMNEEQQAEMAEAQSQMAEFKQQMASMPPDQQAMIMRQMGPQMEMLENLAAGNGMEIVSQITAMRCNTGLPTVQEYSVMMPGGTCGGFNASTPGNMNMAPPAGQTGAAGSPSSSTMNTLGTQPSPAAAKTRSDTDLKAAQQACIEDKIAAAQASQKKKRGFGRLASAISRTAGKFGNYDVARTVGDIYDVNATADDLSAAAKDLGLTEDDIAACQNPD